MKKDCINCKHSYNEDLYNELVCSKNGGKLCPNELIWSKKNPKLLLDVKWGCCDKWEPYEK